MKRSRAFREVAPGVAAGVAAGVVAAVTVAAVAVLLMAGPAWAAVDVAGWSFKDMSAQHVPLTFRLAFDEHRIAWAQWDGAQTDVYVLDVAGGDVTQVTSTPESEQPVALEGDWVVWMTRTSFDFNTPVELQLHNLSTGETRTVARGLMQVEAGVRIVGDRVAWAQFEQTQEAPSVFRRELYVYAISTGSTVRVTDQLSTFGAQEPTFDLNQTHVAFVKAGPPEQDPEVWLYRLGDGTSEKIGSTVPISRCLSLEGDVLTWATAGGSGDSGAYQSLDVVACRISTGQGQTLATINTPEPYPKTDGRFVVWDTYDGDLRKIQAYDLEVGRLIDVSHNLFLNFTPQLSDGLVVWERGGELDSEIMAHDLVSGETTQLSDNSIWMDQASQVHGRTVVWWMYWFADQPREDGFMVASAPESYAEPFQDVDGFHRYRTAILGVYERGISSGYLVGSDRFFRPEAPLLRAQFAKMVCEALRVPVTEDMELGFTDLGDDDPLSLYPHEYVAALSALGILKGVGDGRFDPYAPLTRAQAVSVLTRALDALYPGLLADVEGEPPGAYFWDPPHRANLRKAYANDLLGSLVDWMQQWDARTACSRGEAAQLVWNALALIDQEGR